MLESCKELGSPAPEYTVQGDDLTIKFTAFENAVLANAKVPKYQPDTLDDTLGERIIALLKENPTVTQAELAESVKVSLSSIKRIMKKLLEHLIHTDILYTQQSINNERYIIRQQYTTIFSKEKIDHNSHEIYNNYGDYRYIYMSGGAEDDRNKKFDLQ